MVIQESTKVWNSFLRAFYKNPTPISSLQLQYCILHSLWFPLKNLIDAGAGNSFWVVLMERAPEDINLFVDNLAVSNTWTPSNTQAINSLLASHELPPSFATIYLQTDPIVSKSRCDRKNRAGEEEIPLEYLTDLNDRYDNWLLGPTAPLRTFIINGNASSAKVLTKAQQTLQTILKEFKQFSNQSSISVCYSCVI